ncbi:MAG TPA: zinc ribbon domain-containing protein [Methanomassiliicoccales archaeon]|nr:zinc ribbon domain-containing protein [Methanomassiliicoccales archaeon]
MFGGKRIDRARDAQRVREIQDLIRTVAGDVHENGKELEQVKAMMKARTQSAPPKEAPPAPAPKRPEPETPRMVPPPYQPTPPPRAPPVERPRAPPKPPAAQTPPARERPLFCIHCGSRLPVDSYGCPVCASRNSRICPNCGTRVNITMVTCPVCRRVMPPAGPYLRH